MIFESCRSFLTIWNTIILYIKFKYRSGFCGYIQYAYVLAPADPEQRRGNRCRHERNRAGALSGLVFVIASRHITQMQIGRLLGAMISVFLSNINVISSKWSCGNSQNGAYEIFFAQMVPGAIMLLGFWFARWSIHKKALLCAVFIICRTKRRTNRRVIHDECACLVTPDVGYGWSDLKIVQHMWWTPRWKTPFIRSTTDIAASDIPTVAKRWAGYGNSVSLKIFYVGSVQPSGWEGSPKQLLGTRVRQVS